MPEPRLPLPSGAQLLEEYGGGAGPSVRPQRVVRDFPATLPPRALIKALAVAVRHGIEYQESFAGLDSRALGRRQQRRPQTAAARAPVHLHLRDVAAMRLVLRLIEQHLHRAADRALRIFRNQDDSLAERGACAGGTRVRFRPGA